MSRILHLVPGLDSESSGISSAASKIAKWQNAEMLDLHDASDASIASAEEVWVHSTWTPSIWNACRLVEKNARPLVRMVHGNLDPTRLAFHSWKKTLAKPFERRSLRRATRIVATCATEKTWIESFLGGYCPTIEILDLRQFDWGPEIPTTEKPNVDDYSRESLHVLYMGRKHPLKGIGFLEEAVRIANESGGRKISLRIESEAFGPTKEAAFAWSDVVCLPSLSENFGIVVAEALARGKPVVTTDGAPAWADEPRTAPDGSVRLVYIEGYREAEPRVRVRMLQDALADFARA